MEITQINGRDKLNTAVKFKTKFLISGIQCNACSCTMKST